MRYRIVNRPSVTDTLYGIKFIDCISQDDVSYGIYTRLLAIGYELEEIGSDCLKCKEKDSLIKELEQRINHMEDRATKKKVKE